MPLNFSETISVDGKKMLAIIVGALKRDGMHYEVNIREYPRFFLQWSALGRYDLVEGQDLDLPDSLVLAVSDVIEKQTKNKSRR